MRPKGKDGGSYPHWGPILESCMDAYTEALCTELERGTRNRQTMLEAAATIKRLSNEIAMLKAAQERGTRAKPEKGETRAVAGAQS
jgi:hypothetical protein